jgi:hypothetical protein
VLSSQEGVVGITPLARAGKGAPSTLEAIVVHAPQYRW